MASRATVSIETSADRWIPWRNTGKSTRLRLLCLPYAGGSSIAFRAWSAALPDEVEICPIELAGRGSRFEEAPYRDLDRLVRDLAEELRPLLNTPTAIFGHSMGALLAYRLTLYLRDAKLPGPVQLFVSGRRAPHLPRAGADLHELPDPELIAYLRTLNGIPEAVFESRQLLSTILPVLRADLELIAGYTHRPEALLDCPVCAFAGVRDPSTTIDEVAAWREQALPSGFSLYLVPGDHFFLKVPHFLTALRGRLERLLQRR